MTNMTRLKPLDVPWKVSPSLPCLGLGTKSFDGINHGFVTFVGFLGEGTKLCEEFGPYRQIGVTLERIVYARLYPEFSAEDAKRLEGYNWELIPEFRDEDGMLKDHVRRFHDHWNSTNLCPNPAAYIVERSDLIQRLGINETSFKHYLFVGDDYNVEVVAQSLKWEFVERT